MLKELRIKNLALVEELNIVFDSSMVVFSGETGAGKSIILQAIDLLAGKRASSSRIRGGHDEARVEAVYELSAGSKLIDAVRNMGVDTDGEIVVCRILSRKGKSRFYINGALSTSKIAERVSEYLVSVASQHDHQLLLASRFHLDFIDLAGDLWQERKSFGKLFLEWTSLKKKFEELLDKEKEKEQRRDFLIYQNKEISDAKIEIDEDKELERQKKRLKAADELRRRGSNCYKLLSEEAVDALGLARKELETMVEIDENLTSLTSIVAEQSFVIEESVASIRNYIDEIPDDLELLENVTERIDLLQRLKRKYGATLAEILVYAETIREELADLKSMEDMIREVEGQYLEVESKLVDMANELSDARQRVGDRLAIALQEELASLSIDQARFSVKFNEIDKLNLDKLAKKGWDNPEFLFSANPGESLKPLVKVASGGELSRLTLALKCILARKDMVETVIFDEIDAGVGGKAAESVAKKIKELAEHHQVICITHLPQIAACAKEHLLVEKSIENKRTRTTIIPLSGQGKVDELARMLDGETISDESLAFAEELIERNR